MNKKRFITTLLLLTMIFSLVSPAATAYAGVNKDKTAYTVERGDCLYTIGKKLGINWRTIAKLNNIKEPFMIHVGQELKLVADNSKVTPTAVPTKTPTVTPAPVKEAKDEQIHGTTQFSKMVYTRPDFDAINKKVAALHKLADDKKTTIDTISSALTSIDDDIKEIKTMGTLLQIKITTNVMDEKSTQEFQWINEEYQKLTKNYSEACLILLDSSFGKELHNYWTESQIESIRKANETMTEEFQKLSAENNALISQYRQCISNPTVEVNGTSMTQADIYTSKDLTADEMVYYDALLLYRENASAAGIYLDIVKNNKQLAKIAGFDSVSDYYYDEYDRDYTPKDAKKLHTFVKDYIVPIYVQLYASFTPEEIQLVNSASDDLSQFEPSFIEYTESISPEMAKAYKYMKKYGLCDLEAAPNKQVACYTTYLNTYHEPFLSTYHIGNYMDITNYIHEFGHFNAFYQHGSDLDTNLDILEIHSQTNELLFSPYYKLFGDAYEPIMKNQILRMLEIMVTGCMYDEFQQKVYDGDYKTVEELNRLSFDLCCEYGLADPNSKYKQEYNWILVSHTFEQPLYYISYAISLFPSLEIYEVSLTDRDKAIKLYNDLLSYGTDLSFKELLKKTGLPSVFKQTTIEDISTMIRTMFDLPEVDAGKKAA